MRRQSCPDPLQKADPTRRSLRKTYLDVLPLACRSLVGSCWRSSGPLWPAREQFRAPCPTRLPAHYRWKHSVAPQPLYASRYPLPVVETLRCGPRNLFRNSPLRAHQPSRPCEYTILRCLLLLYDLPVSSPMPIHGCVGCQLPCLHFPVLRQARFCTPSFQRLFSHEAALPLLLLFPP